VRRAMEPELPPHLDDDVNRRDDTAADPEAGGPDEQDGHLAQDTAASPRDLHDGHDVVISRTVTQEFPPD
jgi:hypothetical protein